MLMEAQMGLKLKSWVDGKMERPVKQSNHVATRNGDPCQQPLLSPLFDPVLPFIFWLETTYIGL